MWVLVLQLRLRFIKTGLRHCLCPCLCSLCTSGGLKATSTRWYVRVETSVSVMVMDTEDLCRFIKPSAVTHIENSDLAFKLLISTDTLFGSFEFDMRLINYPTLLALAVCVKIYK